MGSRFENVHQGLYNYHSQGGIRSTASVMQKSNRSKYSKAGSSEECDLESGNAMLRKLDKLANQGGGPQSWTALLDQCRHPLKAKMSNGKVGRNCYFGPPSS